jgi:GTP-binding protein
VVLNKSDALTPDELKQQKMRLKRAAKQTPLVMSAATGAGVPEVLHALAGAIGKAHAEAAPAPEQVAEWHP